MDIDIVVDVGFGDSGKGITVDYLASQKERETLVVRFSGGHQVGHTVKKDGFKHTFSNFGAASLRGVPTFYTKYTTIFPPAILAEYEVIQKYKPILILSPLVMVTTPYDIAYNRALEKSNGHGSCGVGFGATIERNQGPVKLYVKDLQHIWVFKQKLDAICNYYNQKIIELQNDKVYELYQKELKGYQDDNFITACKECLSLYAVANLQTVYKNYEHLIFEGSQGIMLDQNHGIFPHVTRSNTTSRNAIAIIQTLKEVVNCSIAIYYVSRCYQTRHGNGPMSSETPVVLINNEAEANKTNDFQGRFRTATLDIKLIDYALKTDALYHNKDELNFHYNFVLTCLDQLPAFDVKKFLKEDICTIFSTLYGSYSPSSKDFKILTVSN